MGKQKETKLKQDRAEMDIASRPGQYIYHPRCYCSRCLDKRQATSMWGQFRMILKKLQATSNKQQATSNKHQAPEATSNKHLTSLEYKII